MHKNTESLAVVKDSCVHMVSIPRSLPSKYHCEDLNILGRLERLESGCTVPVAVQVLYLYKVPDLKCQG